MFCPFAALDVIDLHNLVHIQNHGEHVTADVEVIAGVEVMQM